MKKVMTKSVSETEDLAIKLNNGDDLDDKANEDCDTDSPMQILQNTILKLIYA